METEGEKNERILPFVNIVYRDGEGRREEKCGDLEKEKEKKEIFTSRV